MIVPNKLEELRQLIEDGIEESINLEYKAADALTDVKEISKDVSAMANSDGGVIIYGIKEFDDKDRKHKPEKITPIVRSNFSKERLEHIINGNISPRLESMRIHPIPLSDTEVAYVVEIPQSNTAHQNTKDFKYYRRFNFESVPMLDYEIRDIMNRNKNPIVELSFEIVKETVEQKNKYLTFSISDLNSIKKYSTTLTLKITPSNNGTIIAHYINYFVYVPENLLNNSEILNKKVINGLVEFFGENTYRDVVDYISTIGGSGGIAKYGPSRYDPILPGLMGRSKNINLVENSILNEREIIWTVYADSANSRTGKIRLCDINYIEKESTE